MTEQGPTDASKLDYTIQPTRLYTKEEVARLLHCSVDRVSRIQPHELPRCRGPGRWNLYLGEDIIKYIKLRQVRLARRGKTDPIEPVLAEIERDVLGRRHDGVRERSPKNGRTQK